MDLTSFGIAGAFVGWAGYMLSSIKGVRASGPVASPMAGAAGAILGGTIVAPLLAGPGDGPAESAAVAIALATGGALVLLLLAQLAYRRLKL